MFAISHGVLVFMPWNCIQWPWVRNQGMSLCFMAMKEYTDVPLMKPWIDLFCTLGFEK